MSDLQYRPNHYDDWGMIRNADGSMHATVHRPEIYLGEFDDHREVDTDPFADLARKIIFFDDLEAENVSLRHYCEHPSCSKWGGLGYSKSKVEKPRWWCAEHYPYWDMFNAS